MNPEPLVVTEDDRMESNHSDKEKLTPDDSLETETAASELESKHEKPAPEPMEPEGDPDFDVRPADTYLRPDYDPKKSAGPKALWVGVLMVAAIIGLTYYAFRSQPVPDQGGEMTAQEKAPIASPDTASGQQLPTLPEKAPDAADFSPTPEPETADAPASLPATASSSTPPTPAREPGASTTAVTTDKAKAGSGKTAASSQKSKKDEAKSSSTKSAATAAKPTETKSTATTAKPPETKQPAATVAASPDAKTEAAPSATPEATKPDDAQPQVVATASAEAQPAPAVTASEISDLWVVNISSTPDLAESNRLLNRVIATDVGGQVYFYETSIDGRVHHRIRVGFFNSRGEAEAIGQKVKEAFKLSATPWAVKPTMEEVERYQKK